MVGEKFRCTDQPRLAGVLRHTPRDIAPPQPHHHTREDKLNLSYNPRLKFWPRRCCCCCYQTGLIPAPLTTDVSQSTLPKSRLYNGKLPRPPPPSPRTAADATLQLDKLVGLAMLVAASVVFLYYTVWTLLMVCLPDSLVLRLAHRHPSPSSTTTTPYKTSSSPASGPSASPSSLFSWALPSSAPS